MFIDEPEHQDVNNVNPILEAFNKSMLYSLSEKIKNNINYCEFLIKNELLHKKLLEIIEKAIKLHETEEKYEVCLALVNFRDKLPNVD